MSNTLLKVFQREHGQLINDTLGTLTFTNTLSSDTTSLTDTNGEVYILQPITTTTVDSCEILRGNYASTNFEAQPAQSADSTDLLKVRITQLPQAEHQQQFTIPFDADLETLSQLFSRDVSSRSVLDVNSGITDSRPKNGDQVSLLWPPNQVKTSEPVLTEVGLVPVIVGDNLFYINTAQAVTTNTNRTEPVVTQLISNFNSAEGAELDGGKSSAVLSFVVDSVDQIGDVMALPPQPSGVTELPNNISEYPAATVISLKPAVKRKQTVVGTTNGKIKRGRSLLKGSVAAKQARAVPPRTNLCLNKTKKGNKVSDTQTSSPQNNNSSYKIFHPKFHMVKEDDQGDQQGSQQQSLAVVSISSDKTKDLTEIVVNTSKGKQIFKGKTSDLISAMSALWCSNNSTGSVTDNQGDSSGQNGDMSDLEEDDECDDQPLTDALNQINTSLDSLLTMNAQDRSWRCPEQGCDRVFSRLKVLKVHILSHYGVRPFKCDFPRCQWAFYTHFRLKRHRETHLKKKDYKCPIPSCNRSFTTIYNLRTHQKLHQRPAELECPVPLCPSRFQTKRNLELHMKEHGSDHAPYVCPVLSCGKRYYSSNSLNSHVRSHQYKEDEIRCQWAGCNKLFDKPCRLQAHMRIHTGDKPYRCTYQGCTWAFSSSSKLKRHEHKHTNVRKFACRVEGCHKLFMRPEHLREHTLTHSAERPFKCSHNNCQAKFSSKSSLYVHQKKHNMQPEKSEEANRLVMSAPSSATVCASRNRDVTVPPATPASVSESRIIYYCPVEDCDVSLSSMADLRNHVMDVHSPLVADTSQADVMQFLGEPIPVGVTHCFASSEEMEQTPHHDGADIVSTAQLNGPGCLSSSESSVLSNLPEYLTSPHLTQDHDVDPLIITGQPSCASNSPSQDRAGGCARTIPFQSWRLNRQDGAISPMDSISCVPEVASLPDLRVPSDVVLGGALLGSGHDHIAHLLLTEDLGSSALYDSEEGMLTMESPFEQSTINLRDLEQVVGWRRRNRLLLAVGARSHR